MFQRRLAFVVAAFALSAAAPAQQVLRELVPGTGSWNTITDGGFEAGTMSGWGGSTSLFKVTDAEAFAGEFSALTMTPAPGAGPGYAASSGIITVTPGETYVLSCAVHAEGIATGSMYIDMGDIGGEASPMACIGITGWQFIWAPWTADRSSVRIRIVRDGVRDTSDAGYFDEIALTPVVEFVPPDSTYFCYADCSQGGECPGTLDFFDFLCYQNAFAGGDPYADCDRSGSLDFFDFLCYQDAFAAGCP